MSERRLVEWPAHPVGSMRWTYIPGRMGIDGKWERCEVLDVYGEFGTRFGDYPELYDVRRPSGEISRAHFVTSLRDQHPAPIHEQQKARP